MGVSRSQKYIKAFLLFTGIGVAIVFPALSRADMWRYTDSKGEMHYAEDKSEIPPQYRHNAKHVKGTEGGTFSTTGSEQYKAYLGAGMTPSEGHQMIPQLAPPPGTLVKGDSSFGQPSYQIPPPPVQNENQNVAPATKQFNQEKPAETAHTGNSESALRLAQLTADKKEEKPRDESQAPVHYDVAYAVSFLPPYGFYEMPSKGTGSQGYYIFPDQQNSFTSSLMFYTKPLPDNPSLTKEPYGILDQVKVEVLNQYQGMGYTLVKDALSAVLPSFYLYEAYFSMSNSTVGKPDMAILYYQNSKGLILFQLSLPPGKINSYTQKIEAMKQSFKNEALPMNTKGAESFWQRLPIRSILATLGIIIFLALFYLGLRSLREF